MTPQKLLSASKIVAAMCVKSRLGRRREEFRFLQGSKSNQAFLFEIESKKIDGNRLRGGVNFDADPSNVLASVANDLHLSQLNRFSRGNYTHFNLVFSPLLFRFSKMRKR